VHIDVAAGDGGHDRPASGLDVVAPQPVFRAVKPRASFDTNRRRPRARDADAELFEECAQLDHMRLTRGMANLCRTWRTSGGEQRSLGPGDRRLVQIERRRPQAVGSGQRVATAFDAARTHRFQCFEMRVERAPRRKITARRRQLRAPAPREQWAQQQHRAAQAADQRRVGLVLDDAGARTRSVVLPMPSTSPPRSRISRAITSTSLIRGTLVRTHSSAVRRQAASSGKRGILVAFDVDGSGQALTAFDE
jgi:hypothetical protein